MFYAERDRDGRVVAIKKDPGRDGALVEVASEQELLEFLAEGSDPEAYRSLLRLTDSGIVRVLDDLIDVLISKNIIMLTDLPEEARRTIGVRREARRKLHESPLADDDVI